MMYYVLSSPFLYLSLLHVGRFAIEHEHGFDACLQHANGSVEHSLEVTKEEVIVKSKVDLRKPCHFAVLVGQVDIFSSRSHRNLCETESSDIKKTFGTKNWYKLIEASIATFCPK